MIGLRNILVVLLLATGCNSKPKVDNPVVGPPPPRTNNIVAKSDLPIDSQDTSTAIQTTGLQNSELPLGDDLADSQVVATVNGSPIFASELLERYRINLAKAREQLPPEQYRQVREALIKRDLTKRVERKLLVEGLKSTIEPDQIEALDAHLDKLFEEEIARMKKETKVTSHVELDQLLQTQGTSLLSLRDEFGNQRMAMEYLGSKAQAVAKRDFSREELVAYYRAHLEDYANPTRVRWQQLLISFRKHGGKDKAFSVLQQAVTELRGGVKFGDVARRYSDGPKAADNGQWDWTQAGSLANKDIEKALFKLPANTISQVFESDSAFQIVYVNQREEAHHTPFEEVQDDIKTTMQEEAYQAANQTVLNELFESADIWTMFDDRPDSANTIQLQ